MIKRVSVLVVILGLLLVLASPGLVQAESDISIIDSSVQVSFPMSIRFSLSVRSQATITDIRLHYVVNQESHAEITSEAYLRFTPGTTVTAAWTLDMRKTGGLPPGASLDYWWTATDVTGNRAATIRQQVQYNDTRYTWNRLTDDKISLYWYQGDDSFAQELMTVAWQALDRLHQDTGARLENPIAIYIYASAQDLRGALVYPQEWTGGVSFTRHGTIAIGITPSNLDWGKRALAHELAHLVVHQMTFNPYIDLPTWLDEGLAMYAEGMPEPAMVAFLVQAIADGTLISTRSLCSPFSAFPELSYLSYAQSLSLVQFLIDSYGQDSMLALLSIFQQGSTYDGALEQVYGFDIYGLDSRWRQHVTQQAQPVAQRQSSLTVAGIFVTAITELTMTLGLVGTGGVLGGCR